MSRKCRDGLSIGLGLVAALGLWLFRDSLRSRVAETVAFANPSPPPDLVEDIIEGSPDRPAVILAAWNTGKIVHREAAVREIARAITREQPLPRELESIVLAGALDVDMNVREISLSILRDRRHSALPVLAAAQLHDPDPQLRLLGLHYLKGANANFGVPAIIPLLEEDDPFIVVTALKLLENWSGENFGVKLRGTASVENPETGLKEFPEGSHEMARLGAARAKAWWQAHQSEFRPAPLELPREAITARKPVPAGEFSLRALDGRKVRLTEFRGKVALINFWTTWCPACVGEMPELIALQKQHRDRLAIIGVSLDFVPDSHGHIGGHPAVEEQAVQADGDDSHKYHAAALTKIRDKVARTVNARGINYPILLDERNEAGGRFNGGELPTTVIVDANGFVRRRFVGARGLAVFEAMIAEAGRPEPLAFDRSLQSIQ
jgi:thiol-disulfide isomerase/thioredoxin